MPQKAWSAKRERQYEHIKESAKEARHLDDKRAKEIAARTVNKERARSGEARTSSRLVAHGHLVGSPRRPALGHEPAQGPDEGAALQRGQAPGHRGPLEDEQAQLQRAVDRKK